MGGSPVAVTAAVAAIDLRIEQPASDSTSVPTKLSHAAFFFRDGWILVTRKSHWLPHSSILLPIDAAAGGCGRGRSGEERMRALGVV